MTGLALQWLPIVINRPLFVRTAENVYKRGTATRRGFCINGLKGGDNMKELYEAPKAEVVKFENQNIICSSPGYIDDGSEP